MAGRMHWYAVHVMTQKEKSVKDYLDKRINTGNLTKKIAEVFIPHDIETQNKNGKKQIVQKKVYPGYVFVKMVLDEETWPIVRQTPGVTNFVSSGARKPNIIPESDIADMRALANPENLNKLKNKWAKDMMVRINSGPFSDLQGKIQDVNEDKEKLYVVITLFGRDQPVEVPFSYVEKLT
jgi:transcriptional antiterminator NusG